MKTIQERFLKIVFASREFNRSIIFSEVGFLDEEDESISSTPHTSENEYSPGSTSVQVLSPIGMVLVDELAESRLCGFALAFDRLAKARAFDLQRKVFELHL